MRSDSGKSKSVQGFIQQVQQAMEELMQADPKDEQASLRFGEMVTRLGVDLQIYFPKSQKAQKAFEEFQRLYIEKFPLPREGGEWLDDQPRLS